MPGEPTTRDSSLVCTVDHFLRMFRESPIACTIFSPDGRIISMNAAGEELWGLTRENIENGVLDNYSLFQDAALESLGLMPYFKRAFAGESVKLPVVLYDPEKNSNPGRKRWVRSYAYPVKDVHDDVKEVIIVQEDVTEQRQAREDLQDALNHYKALTQAAPVGIFVTSEDGDCQFVNERWCEIAGMSKERALGRGWQAGLHPEDAAWVGRHWYDAAREGRLFKAVYRFMRPDGFVTWVYGQAVAKRDDNGCILGYVGTLTDITEQKQLEEALRRQATVDELTGLPNRVTALDRLTIALRQAHREHEHAVLMFIDLDHFKHINDSLGHHVGDRLLHQCAVRLQNCIREGHTVARFGGDEFLIIMPSVQHAEHAETVAQRVLKAFSTPLLLGTREVFITASIGLAIYPEDGTDAESLLRHADTAMYRAKDSGRNAYLFFRQEMNRRVQERVDLELQLRYALERRELAVHYQPIVDAKSGEAVAVEALLRWNNPKLGMIPAESFIPLAEETGLIVPIGEWVLHTACREIQQFRQQTGADMRLAVNVSPRQFAGNALVSAVRTALDQLAFPADRLELELTERIIVMPEATQALHTLRELGVHLSVDDFGTGYSSLSYLSRLPVSSLKVDQGLIRDVHHHSESAILARGIIGLGHSLGLEIIGEGVENEEQLKFLQAEACDYVQGFYFSSALTLPDLIAWIKRA